MLTNTFKSFIVTRIILIQHFFSPQIVSQPNPFFHLLKLKLTTASTYRLTNRHTEGEYDAEAEQVGVGELEGTEPRYERRVVECLKRREGGRIGRTASPV